MDARKLGMFLPAILALGVVLSLVSSALACPFCDGGAAGVNEVKSGIFNEMFWPRAIAVLAPFPVLLGLVALIYFWPQPRQDTLE